MKRGPTAKATESAATEPTTAEAATATEPTTAEAAATATEPAAATPEAAAAATTAAAPALHLDGCVTGAARAHGPQRIEHGSTRRRAVEGRGLGRLRTDKRNGAANNRC